MDARLNKKRSSQPAGDSSNVSSYPESEARYFERRYGSDHLKQLHDGHQEKAILSFCKPERRAEIKKILRSLYSLPCINYPGVAKPGRSAYSLEALRYNLNAYRGESWRSLRWNEHYQSALEFVREQIKSECVPKPLKPMSYEEVSTSRAVRKNIDKNAGYIAFESGKRSKGENLELALNWVQSNKQRIITEQDYGLPLVISHRSSNSKPSTEWVPTPNGYRKVRRGWKWKCRIILMQDIRALLLDGRFAIPFTTAFRDVSWGEGSMNSEDVTKWIDKQRNRHDLWFSSDYKSFDVSESAWCLEDIFNKIIRPCFGTLSPEDEALFQAMVYSYIHKDIHTFDGVIHADKANISGSLLTYAVNTIYNQVVKVTVLKMMGINPNRVDSLLCGDDNLSYYDRKLGFDTNRYCELVQRYFGITTTIGERDQGTRFEDPTFLSRQWTRNGAERDIDEVLWNLVYPESFRDYSEEVTGVPEQVAAALILYTGYLEQPVTFRRYFNVYAIMKAANIKSNSHIWEPYHRLAKMGTGFATSWIRWKLDLAS